MGNNVINTFLIKYMTNAEKVIKDNKDIQKSTKETKEGFKDADEQISKFGTNFNKAIDSIATAGAAFAGFNVLKNGIQDAANLNIQLGVMQKLTGQIPQQLVQMAYGAEALGGSVQGFLADVQGNFKRGAVSGYTLKDISGFYGRVREELSSARKNNNYGEMARILDFEQINDPGSRRALEGSDKDYQFFLNGMKDKASAKQKEVDAALDYQKANAGIDASKQGFFSGLSESILPFYNAAANTLSGSPTATGVATIGAAVGEAIGVGALVKWAAKRLGVGAVKKVVQGAAVEGTEALAGGVGLSIGGSAALATGVITASLAAGGAAGWFGAGLFKDAIVNRFAPYKPVGPMDGPLTNSVKTGNRDLDFWMSQGYSAEQAAGIMANMNQESRGNPMARGDNGTAHGLFQWHADRRANIFAKTGIDVSNASYDDQLKAAAWEMKNGRPGFNDDYFRSIKDAGSAGSYFSTQFESPADRFGQSLLRGKNALSLASQFSSIAGGGGTTVKIDKIEINTQATDAKGIALSLSDELNSHINILIANNDDGRAM